MYWTGTAKPVYMTIMIRMTEAGARACSTLLLIEAISRNIMLMARSIAKEMSKKKKKGPGSRRRFVIKYNVQLTKVKLMNLYGRSMIMDATASALG